MNKQKDPYACWERTGVKMKLDKDIPFGKQPRKERNFSKRASSSNQN